MLPLAAFILLVPFPANFHGYQGASQSADGSLEFVSGAPLVIGAGTIKDGNGHFQWTLSGKYTCSTFGDAPWDYAVKCTKAGK